MITREMLVLGSLTKTLYQVLFFFFFKIKPVFQFMTFFHE